MQSMNISLPEALKQFADGQVTRGRYSSVNEYIGELIRADEERKANVEREALRWLRLIGEESEVS